MRLIDADVFKIQLENAYEYTELGEVIDMLDNAPTVETKTIEECIIAYGDGYETARRLYERPQGEWIKQYGKSYELITNEGVLVGEFTKCPKCKYDKARGSNFCPHCGADMRGKEE